MFYSYNRTTLKSICGYIFDIFKQDERRRVKLLDISFTFFFVN